MTLTGDDRWELWLYDEKGGETLLETAYDRTFISLHPWSLEKYGADGWTEFKRVKGEGVIFRRWKWFRWQYRMYIILPSQQRMYKDSD